MCNVTKYPHILKARVISNMNKLLQKLQNKPSFTTEEAVELGVSKRMLSYYVQKGELERIARGVYCSTSYQSENIEPFSDLWSNFLRGNELGDLDMNEVIKLINSTIQKVISVTFA